MKIISFSAPEILPSLLNKSKVQTIRPAWKLLKGKTFAETQRLLSIQESKEATLITMSPAIYEWCVVEIPAGFRAGERIQLMWKQRSKNNEWCSKCLQGDPETMFPNDGCMNCGAGMEYMFSKKLGEAIITEVFKIHIQANLSKEGEIIGRWMLFDRKCEQNAMDILVEKDGFKSVGNFFKFFNDTYNISKETKPFWVYRWKWKN